ncbi:tetratricopeptide repeat protein [Polyangium sorediatum]|uniref:Tetratricopeptide repeat protein n=1 Tax=Polyangium sorediatum TaxID=889274 RepID=A0ABT6NYQ7_9BACT|nr:tetratricopeptide repeat protein [Polyangium sorediatum]MDI1433428.1 tetratricopeptide repeat protein [Polyangium sorediatum]
MRTRTTAIAALFVALPALSVLGPTDAHAQAPAAAATPSAADVAEAKKKFEAGSNLFKTGKFEKAIEEFRASYAKVNSPNSHLYVARCLREMGKLVDAYLEFEKVAAEAQTAGEKYAQTGETAKVERDELNTKLTLVSVDVATPESGARLTIGGVEVPQDRWGKPFPAMPGTVDIRLESGAKPAASQSLTTAAGESKTVSIGFASPKTGGGDGSGDGSGDGGSGGETGSKGMSGMRIGAFAAGGLGVAGFVTFAVFGSMSNATYDDLKATCGGPCPADRQGDVDKGKMQQTVANVGLIVGAVGVAAGATLFVLSLKKDKKPEAAHTELVVGPAHLGVRGTF